VNDHNNPTRPRVTIVVVPREQFHRTQLSLDTLYARTPEPFDLIFVDGNSPPPIQSWLRAEASKRRFHLIRVDRYLTANEARNIALREAATEYVVFLDNDVVVAEGWLDALLRCAEETDAWAVGPLYCFGAGGSDTEPSTVHTAGANLAIVDDPLRGYREQHLFVGWRVSDVRPRLRRGAVDLIEFHCMLVRRDVFATVGALDEELLSFLDHVDFCLDIRKAGGTIFLEPAAMITHLSPPPIERSDVPFYLLRWSDAWLRRSIKRFAAKHGLSTRDQGFLDHIHFRNDRRRLLLGPLRQAISRVSGRLGRRIFDELADRVLFDFVVEHTLVRNLEKRRTKREPRA
jgi:GT2 family glycosyltransferase